MASIKMNFHRATELRIWLAGLYLAFWFAFSSSPVSAQAPDPGDSTKVLNLTTFATFSSIINSGAIDLQHSYDGTGRVFVSTNEGKIHAFSSTGASLGTFLDLDAPGVLPDFEETLGSFTTRGLTYMTFHPDYGNTGAAGAGKLYTIYKTSEPSTSDHTYTGVGLPTKPGSVISEYAIAEWTVDTNNPNKIDTTSRREVMRFEVSGPSENTHSVGQLIFNPFARPGDPDFGNLYIPLGDMHNEGSVPNWQHVQNANNPFGKVLRINPLQNGINPYSVPADNPLNDGGSFLDNDGNTEEIYAWGFRYPQNLSFAKDAAGNVRLVVFDIGGDDFEEVNLVDLGDNHGWTRYDGPNSGNLSTTLNLPPGSTLEFPATAFDHEIPHIPGATPSGGQTAITGGFVVSDPNDPNFQNQLVFGDLSRGAFFHADFEELVAADAANAQALMYVMNVSIDGGTPGAFRDLIGQPRGDQRFGVDESGRLFVFSRREGEDIIYVTDLIADQRPDTGDFNEDGDVDGADFLMWQRGEVANPPSATHFAKWQANYGTTGLLSATSTAVPEPISVSSSLFILIVIFCQRSKAKFGLSRRAS
ncbi:PQQ-dependent sugar dehydrogenase [Bythopirellula polymerisocia]|uniref:Glucose/Sorbosone dehydrogenase domain-containing protein n=1 Tax=Bythopirellula polymerisocia TaxID=2528003 RepID=A0A5C6CYT8_9BACT|nr:PQQ-dependent sugar dehydrogenase [Bythopirellula polymerisocia]TWU28641.1 hypothetical protein Pla144_19330 [Bythopirellula polymerisocia]